MLSPDQVKTPAFWTAWLFRELTAFPLYCYAMAGSAVEWRGKSYKLKPDGTVVLKNKRFPAIPETLKSDDGDIDKKHARAAKLFAESQRKEAAKNKERRETVLKMGKIIE